MSDDELKLMLYEANGGDKNGTVTEEQFEQVLTRATNMWLTIYSSIIWIEYSR